jgi:Ca-activated chloride channel family protein
VIGAVLLLALGLVGTGYALVARGCDGSATLSVVAAPDHSPVLSSLARRWSASEPIVDGRCARVEVASTPPARTVDALAPDWNSRRDGRRPDVWAPDASTWVQLARARPAARGLLGGAHPSTARTPVVVALPRPMAEALGWPDQQLGWPALVKRLQSPAGWAGLAHPEWGPMRLGMADPAHDTAALAALLAIVNYDGDTAISPTELAGGREFRRLVSRSTATTTDLLHGLAESARAGTPLGFASAFPATERDVGRYNATAPAVPLAADYPPDGAPSADHPYVVLKAPWVDPLHRAIAGRFLEFVRGPIGLSTYASEGFRPPDGAATSQTSEQWGLMPAGFAERETPAPAVVAGALQAWPGLRSRNVRPGR